MMSHLRGLRIVRRRHKGLPVTGMVRLIPKCTVGAL